MVNRFLYIKLIKTYYFMSSEKYTTCIPGPKKTLALKSGGACIHYVPYIVPYVCPS